jgi:hypothetical protein
MKVPIFGQTKKSYVYAAGGLIVALGVYGYYRSKQASASATTTQAEIDPATGFPYGSPEDAAALSAQESFVSPNTPIDTSSAGPVSPVGGFTNNADWARAAQDYIVSSADGDPATVGAALGAYIAGREVNDAQETIINQGIAFENYPPVAGLNGYPPSIHKISTPAPSPSTVKYVVQSHAIAKTEGARHLVARFSTATATTSQIETALQKTVQDHRNSAEYVNGQFRPGLIYVTTVQRA